MTERVDGVAEPVQALGVVVAHGDLAAGLVSAAARIAGVPEGALVAVSNDGHGPDELQAAIQGAVGSGPAIVFTDLGAGSCTLAARVSCRERAEVGVITGVNLPMLLDFLFNRDRPLRELLLRLEEKSRAGIRILPTG